MYKRCTNYVQIMLQGESVDKIYQSRHNRCTFEYPNWANLCGPRLNCTANLQILKQTCVPCQCQQDYIIEFLQLLDKDKDSWNLQGVQQNMTVAR